MISSAVPPGVSPVCDLSPTRKSQTNDKGVLWRRHTMSDWHRNTNPDETAYITQGQLIEERPYLAVKKKKNDASSPIQHHYKDYAEQSLTFSDRLITAELQPIPIITDYRRRPPRHLDPRIRGWDLNVKMWWPATLAPANLKAGQEDERTLVERRTLVQARSEAALHRDGTPRTPPRKSSVARPSKDLLQTPSPLSRASISGSGGSNSPLRRGSKVSSRLTRDDPAPPAEMLPEYVIKRGISMPYNKWVERHGMPQAPSLPYLTLHGDFKGADRQYAVQVGSVVRPSGQCLNDVQVP
jgi:hypothetical protein